MENRKICNFNAKTSTSQRNGMEKEKKTEKLWKRRKSTRKFSTTNERSNQIVCFVCSFFSRYCFWIVFLLLLFRSFFSYAHSHFSSSSVSFRSFPLLNWNSPMARKVENEFNEQQLREEEKKPLKWLRREWKWKRKTQLPHTHTHKRQLKISYFVFFSSHTLSLSLLSLTLLLLVYLHLVCVLRPHP